MFTRASFTDHFYNTCLIRLDSYVPPGTPHLTFAITNNVCMGRHFYSGANLVASCLSIFHTTIQQAVLTNTDHPEAKGYLARILLWYCTVAQTTDSDRLRCKPLSISKLPRL